MAKKKTTKTVSSSKKATLSKTRKTKPASKKTRKTPKTKKAAGAPKTGKTARIKKTSERTKKRTIKKPALKIPEAPLPDTIIVESAKFVMQSREKTTRAGKTVAAPPHELPLGYGNTKLALLVRDPEWIFAYWEINDATRKKHSLIRGKHDKTLALRIYDITGVDFNGENALRYYDVIINDYVISWYLRMPEADRIWCVELGYYDPREGRFVALVRSNVVRTPSGMISPVKDEQWMRITKEGHEELVRLSSGVDIRDFSGSEHMMQVISEKLKMKVEQSAGASEAAGSGHMAKRSREHRDFWLTVHTDLVLYGATEPGATVTVQGEKVKLRNDGSFSGHFSLPEGTQTLAVRAVNKQGDQEREIVSKVRKETC